MGKPWFLNQRTLHTFPSDTLAAGEDSVVEAEGNMWKLASLGDLTISFWRYKRWCRNFETHASNESCDFTWRKIHYQESMQDNTYLNNLLQFYLFLLRMKKQYVFLLFTFRW